LGTPAPLHLQGGVCTAFTLGSVKPPASLPVLRLTSLAATLWVYALCPSQGLFSMVAVIIAAAFALLFLYFQAKDLLPGYVRVWLERWPVSIPDGQE